MSTTTTYPIGEFEFPEHVTSDQRAGAISVIEQLPTQLGALVASFKDGDLNKTYREGGWNVRQIIHHMADSHMNAYIRFKLAVTEDNPSILGYNQDAWANLADVNAVDIEYSLAILTGVHKRWSALLNSFGDREWGCTYFHPEWNRNWTMEEAVMQYEWHCRHHLAHINMAISS